MKPNAPELAALTRLFSSAVFRELAKKGRSSLFARLLSLTDIYARSAADATVGTAFDSAFCTLQTSGRRDEYVYRTALIHKILMGKHSLRTASMLNEFRAGICKADLAILNGTATVYEIKSERDSLVRLANQVKNYKRVFASINVIASECHVKDVLETVPDDVGIMCLSSRYRISVIRDAIDRPDRICPLSVFDSLRSAEAATILDTLGVKVRDLPNTQRRASMRVDFAKLQPRDVHSQMVRTLKRTRNLAPLSALVDHLPKSLHAAALSIPIRRSEHERLVDAVATPLRTIMSWA